MKVKFTDEEEQIIEVILQENLRNIYGVNIMVSGILKSGEECLENEFKKSMI